MEAVAGLDIGSSRIVAAVAVPVPGTTAREPACNRATLAEPATGGLKTGVSGTMGLRRGQVNDASNLSRSVREALTQAESACGVKIETACVGLPGHTVEFCKKIYGNLIGKRRINNQDIERIRRLAMVSDLPPGRRIIQALPLEYLVDGIPVAGDPLGMHCSRLEIECLVVTADNELVDLLVEAVHKAGIGVIDIIPSTLAAGEVLLTKAQKQLGTALVDIGGSCTCILVYNHDRPEGYEVLPVGSDHITSDLAICLRTTLAGADEVKRSIGLGTEMAGGTESENENGKPEGTITIPRMSGSGFNEVSRKTAVDIVRARTCEILDMVASSTVKLTGGMDLPGGLVLAGAGSMLRGLDLFAPEYLGVKVQTGFAGASHIDFNAAGAAGLLRYCQGLCQRADSGHQHPAGLLSRVKEFFGTSK